MEFWSKDTMKYLARDKVNPNLPLSFYLLWILTLSDF